MTNWRKNLEDMGGYENELVAVPAGGVRLLIAEFEDLQKQLAEREKQLAQTQMYALGKKLLLAEREKQIVMLREHAKAIQGHMNLYRLFNCLGSDSYDPESAEKNLDKVSEHVKALAATQDLKGLGK